MLTVIENVLLMFFPVCYIHSFILFYFSCCYWWFPWKRIYNILLYDNTGNPYQRYFSEI